MQRVEVRRRFAAPRQAVWERYTDHASWTEWAGLGRARLAREGSPDVNGVGCVREIGSGPLTVREEVVDFEPPEHMSYRVVRGGLPMKEHFGEVRFEEDGDGTRVVWSCRFESRIPGLGAPMRWLVERVFRGALAGLAARHFPDPPKPE